MDALCSRPIFSQVQKERHARESREWSEGVESKIKQPIVDRFERESHYSYASARLWDDGVIDPKDTRQVLGLALQAALNAPIPDAKFGVFRM